MAKYISCACTPQKVTDSYMTAILFTISMNFSWPRKKLGYIKYAGIKPIARSL